MRRSTRRSTDMLSGIVENQFVTLSRTNESKRNASVTRGGLNDNYPSLILPSRSAASIMALPIRSLTLKGD